MATASELCDFKSEEWADVTPVPQDDGPAPVVPICYTPEFTEAMNYFRAVMAADERSERALKVTNHVIQLNPANYTAWHFRRQCLTAVGADLRAELNYVDEAIGENPKNYQVWYHRRFLVNALDDGSSELAFTKAILTMDSKNYHAWSHRQWVLKRFNLWSEELGFVEELLADDVRNNSAWNHRWYVIEHTDKLTPAVRAREVDYTMDKIQLAVHNESPWNYLRGLLRGEDLSSETYMRVLEACQALAANTDTRSAALLATLVDFAVAMNDIETAKQLCKSLETKEDTMRARYWRYRRASLPEAREDTASGDELEADD